MFHALYETSIEQFAWISNIIIEYNKLGFHTVTSQPGNVCKQRYQRAYIRGYMDKYMSEYIIDNIQNENIFARSEIHNGILHSSHCNCGSVIFTNDVPGTYNFEYGKFQQSFNLGIPLHRPYDIVKTWESYPFLPKDLKNITEFDAIDLRWNYNDDLWSLLLQLIKQFILPKN